MTQPETNKKNAGTDRNPRHHAAHFLLLFGTPVRPRVALLDRRKRVLTEMIGDDGFVVDSLVRRGRPCAPPAPATLKALDPQAVDDPHLRCFALG